MIQISGIQSQTLFEPTIILLRSTTWKCGKVERIVINYLQKRLQQGYTQSPVKELMEHFESQEIQHYQMFGAIERLKKRGIIKMVVNIFSSSDEFDDTYAKRRIKSGNL